MGPVVVDIDPVLVSLGPFALRWYGLAIAAGVGAGFALALREARRKGLAGDDIYSLGFWAILSAFVGARLFHVVDNWTYYLANPLAVLDLQNGGLAILGGILGGTLGGLLYARRRGLATGRIADAAAPGLILGQAIGRIGCTINGDALGAPTNLPWGFAYVNPASLAPELGVAYHPTMLYEMGWDLLVLAILWRGRSSFKPDGALFLAYLGLYSAGKFAISFFRQEAVWFWGLQEAQVVSLLTIAATGIAALWLARCSAAPVERATR